MSVLQSHCCGHSQLDQNWAVYRTTLYIRFALKNSNMNRPIKVRQLRLHDNPDCKEFKSHNAVPLAIF